MDRFNERAISNEEPSDTRWPLGLTVRRLMLFVIGWLMLFAALSIFVSNPFQTETSASAPPDYALVMFLHGLLVGMLGLMSLLACDILRLRSRHVRAWIAGGTIVATILAAVGGIWNRSIPGSEVPMWTQVIGFFALDEILLLLVLGIVFEWRTRSTEVHPLVYVGAALAGSSMLLAAIMGHLAGWIKEFGPHFPSLIARYANTIGFASSDDFVDALVDAHSHEIVVAAMAMTVILFAQQAGYRIRKGIGHSAATTGLVMVAVGTVAMTAIYLTAGVAPWEPPRWFVSGPSGVNGIESDDIVTGILVMGGGALAAAALVLRPGLFHRPLRLAAAWTWLLAFAIVVIAGYAIELHTVHFGAGDRDAPGAAGDAIYTWLHQDIGLFLFPALVLVMLAVERLINREKWRPNSIGWAVISGTTVTFLGALVYVFVAPSLYGPGYVLSTVGLVIVGIALLATLWWGAVGALEHSKRGPADQTRAASRDAA
jgi:hypothetical protein